MKPIFLGLPQYFFFFFKCKWTSVSKPHLQPMKALKSGLYDSILLNEDYKSQS